MTGAKEANSSDPATSEKEKVIPLKGLRKVIADRMVSSHLSIPHVTLTMEVDVTDAVKLIEDLEKQIKAHFSLNTILVKVIAKALEAYPILNSSLEGNEIKMLPDINVGLAISIKDGIIVPVIRDANKKSLTEINEEVEDLIKRARENRLSISEVTGGTFTLTNLGMFGVNVFTPIILPGEVAILGVGKISDEPKVIGDSIKVRKTMMLSLSFDHRVMDGAVAAQFLDKIKEFLEKPYESQA